MQIGSRNCNSSVMFEMVPEPTFEALHVVFLTLTSPMDSHADRITQLLLIYNV